MFTDYYAEQSCTAGRSSFITLLLLLSLALALALAPAPLPIGE
jgi:hypothetical protein